MLRLGHRGRYPAKALNDMYSLNFICIALFSLVISVQASVAQEEHGQAVRAPKEPPFVGEWKIVSKISNSQLAAIPDNSTFFLLPDMIAEYDRTPRKAPVPTPKTTVSLSNAKWTDQDGIFRSGMYRFPASKFRMERFSQKNIDSHCYLQVSGDSAVLVISKTELKSSPFDLNTLAALSGHYRVLTLSRIDESSKTRLHHIENMSNFISDWFGDIGPVDGALSRTVGGFLVEVE